MRLSIVEGRAGWEIADVEAGERIAPTWTRVSVHIIAGGVAVADIVGPDGSYLAQSVPVEFVSIGTTAPPPLVERAPTARTKPPQV